MSSATRHTRQKGFTYLMLLWWVAISGVMLVAVSRSWVMDARRQREAELIFRGEQIRRALQSYYDASPKEPKTLPTTWQDLLEDRRGPKLLRHLRRAYKDPITFDGDWGVIRQGAFIKGVYSVSTLKPVKGLDERATYRDWHYEVDAAVPAASAGSAASAAETSAAASAASMPTFSIPSFTAQP